ncbi:MAG: oxaloacetate decarboxylase [Methyloprofundus sp.]|nr:oxaloacetate decarboxylase [Methyloprofundus sp.]
MNETMAQGIELMLTGMGIVFLFLVMLIGAVKLMAYLVATFLPEAEPVSPTASSAPAANTVTPVVAAAITAAVHQHRATHK